MSDGSVLERVVTEFSDFEHDYGWKKFSKVKTVDAQKWVQEMLADGWHVTKKNVRGAERRWL